MAYALSPGVTIVEKDFTNIVPAVSSSTGAFAGKFQWGPIEYPVQLSSEVELIKQFGKPNDSTFESFFTAANFLSYTNSLYISRIDSLASVNAVSTGGTAVKIKNVDAYDDLVTSTYDCLWAAKYAGILGNSLKVSMADRLTFKNLVLSSVTSSSIVPIGGTTVVGVSTLFVTELHVGAILKTDAGVIIGTVKSIESNTSLTLEAPGSVISVPAGTALKADWAYNAQFDSAPGTSDYVANSNALYDELHIIVIDEDGVFSGIKGTILEKFAYVSKVSDAKKYDGTINYYKEVINTRSQYIWWMDHTANISGTGTAWGTAVVASASYAPLKGALNDSFSGALDDFVDSDGAYAVTSWELYLNDSQYDISLIPVGKSNFITANYVIQNIAEVRKDCVVFVSPQDISTGDAIIGSGSTVTDKINAYRNGLTSSSYGIMDSGYKYQYDRYNDKYRWVPLNGDIAGMTARTDYTNDAWWSPAGYNRGQVKNVVKLAANLSKIDRDSVYKNGVNPVVTFPGQGTVLFGDKTLLAKPSAFDRINVRRLFIVLEKAIATASKYQLFEFNDAFTRAQFKNIVEPFLRDVKGRRGVIDFRVICDDTNNTGEVIDRNEFVGDIYVKPARSINYITLNFIAVRSGISFSEIGG
jgi:phage tail sheath protein FI